MRLTLEYIVALLEGATAPDAHVRMEATKVINKCVVDANRDYYRLLLQLVSDQTKDSSIRRQAAIQAKNFTRFTDSAMRRHHLEVWHAFRQKDRADLLSSLLASLGDPVVGMYMANILSAILEAEIAIAHNSVKTILENVHEVYMSAKQTSPVIREQILNIFVYFYEDVSPIEAHKLGIVPGSIDFFIHDALGMDPTPKTMAAGLKILSQKFKHGVLDPTFVYQLLRVLTALDSASLILLITPMMSMLTALLSQCPDALAINDDANTQTSLPLKLAIHATRLAKIAYLAQSGDDAAKQARAELPSSVADESLHAGHYYDPLVDILTVLEFWDVMAVTQLITRPEFTSNIVESLISEVLLPIIFSCQFTDQSLHTSDLGNIKDAASVTLGYIVSCNLGFYNTFFPFVFKLLEAVFKCDFCKDPTDTSSCLRDLNIFLIIRAFICRVADDLPESHGLTPQITWLLNLTFDRVSFIAAQNANESAPHYMSSLSLVAAEIVARLAEQMPKRLIPLIELYLNKCVQPLLYNKLPSGKIIGYGLQVFTYFSENVEISTYLTQYLPPILQHLMTQIANFITAKDETNASALIQAGNQHAELIMACFSSADNIAGLDTCLTFFITVLKDIGPRVLSSSSDEMPAGLSFMEMVLTYMTQTLVSYAYCTSKNFNVDLILSSLMLVLQLLYEIYLRVDVDRIQVAATDFIVMAIFIEDMIPQISDCIKDWLKPGTVEANGAERPTLLAICGHFLEVNTDSYNTHHAFIILLQHLLHLTSPEKMELIYKILMSRFGSTSTIKTKEAIMLVLFEAVRIGYLSFQDSLSSSQPPSNYARPIEELYQLLKECSTLCANGIRTDRRGLHHVSTGLAQLSKATVKLFEMVLHTSITRQMPLDTFMECMSGSIDTIVACHDYEDESIQLDLKSIYTLPFKGIFLSMFTVASTRVSMLSNYACRSANYSFLKRLSTELGAETEKNYVEIHRSFLNACSSLITGNSMDK